LRELGDAFSPIRRSETETLLGEGAIWVLLGCLQHGADPDPRTPAELLRAMLRKPGTDA
jgi:hypothetical protein